MVNLQKKGAVELSLNLIIMLVIGLTVLGLVIAFVTNFLGSAEDSFVGKLSEDDKTKIQQVIREQGNFAFLESTVTIKQGDSTPGKLYMKVRNPESAPFIFIPVNGEVLSSGEIGVVISAGRTEGSGSGVSAIKVFGPPISLEQGETEGYTLEVYANEADIGTYYATFTINFGSRTETKIVTIRVE